MGLPPGTVVARQWRVHQLIGRGTFSEIYEVTRIVDDRVSRASDIGVDATTHLPRVAAVKIGTGGDMGTLKREASCLAEMGRTGCSATFFGQDTKLKALVMRRMGENLSAVKRRCARGHTFCVRDSVVTALHMLRCLRAVHRIGYVHRDVKLSNFVLGPPTSTQDCAKVFVIDFGLSRRVLVADDPRATMKHLPERPVAEFRGTSMYASAGAHASKDLGRVDDLWSFLFVVVDLLCGRLPWREAVKAGDKTAVAELKRKCFEDPHLLFAAPRDKIATGAQGKTSQGSTILLPLVSLAEAHLYANAQDTVFSIAMHLKGLRFADTPSYQRIRDELESLLRLCLPGNSNRAIADHQLLLPANIVHRAVPKPRVSVGAAQSPSTTRPSAADPVVATSGLMTSAAGASPPPRLQRPAKLSFATPTSEFKSAAPASFEVSTPVEGGFTPAVDARQQGTHRNGADDNRANQDLAFGETGQDDTSGDNTSNPSSPGNEDEPQATWNKYWDSNYETWYWHNAETKVSQWTDPFAGGPEVDAARASAGLSQSDCALQGDGEKAVSPDQKATREGVKRKLASNSDAPTSQKRARDGLEITLGTSTQSEEEARVVPESESSASLVGAAQEHQGWLPRTRALLQRAAKGEAVDRVVLHRLYLEALQSDDAPTSAGKGWSWSGSQPSKDARAMQLLLDTQLTLRRLEAFLFRRKSASTGSTKAQQR